MKTRRIQWEETLDLRSRVLRPGMPIEACYFNNDREIETLHFGTFDKDKALIAVGTFHPESFVNMSAVKPFRLRGMAVDPERRRRGAGRELLIHAEKELRNISVDFLWFNARQVAFDFYQALGYQFYGDVFDIEDVGPHKVMYKRF